MTPVGVLKDAMELLSDPSRFTKGAFTRNSNGATTHVLDNDSVRYCSLGAIRKSSNDRAGYVLAARILIEEQIPLKYDSCIVAWNDDPSTTHDDVLRVFRLAIK